eukprot:scaffold210301_cov32-Tisochrysis_lutea.AAC.1
MDEAHADRQRLMAELLQAQHELAASRARFEALLQALASRVQTCFADAVDSHRQGSHAAALWTAKMPTPTLDAEATLPMVSASAPASAEATPASIGGIETVLQACPRTLGEPSTQGACMAPPLAPRGRATIGAVTCPQHATRLSERADTGLSVPRFSGEIRSATRNIGSVSIHPGPSSSTLPGRAQHSTDVPPQVPKHVGAVLSLAQPHGSTEVQPQPNQRAMNVLPLAPRSEENVELSAEEDEMELNEDDEAEIATGRGSSEAGDNPRNEKSNERADQSRRHAERESDYGDSNQLEMSWEDDDSEVDDDEDAASHASEESEPQNRPRLMTVDDLEIEERPRQTLLSLDDLSSESD